MKVEACRSNTEIVLTITPLIDRSLLMSINRCELKINGVTCIPLTSTNLSIHTESVANKSVAITCPICDDEHNIYHVIPTSTLTDSGDSCIGDVSYAFFIHSSISRQSMSLFCNYVTM